MKIVRIKKVSAVLLLIIIMILCSYYFYSYSKTSNDCTFVKAKAYLFQEAINNFGPISPDDAANLWAQGVKTRNGALQYATFNENLKRSFSAQMEKERPSWVTGVSSPWVEKYSIIEKSKINDNEYVIIVKFYLATSTGVFGEANARLTVDRQNGYWYISDIKRDPELVGY